ncbi:hypothetical protein QUF76_02830 [Desulfobacterales bacterium HSG16]|nr:hypothetical protein [Desulfobacterales bacterium HSG16]
MKKSVSITNDHMKSALLFAVLLSIQWLLFKQYAYREILWGYPDFSDQSAYLSRAFSLYDMILHKGLFNALEWDFFKARGTGSFLHLHGAFSFLLNGPDRFNAITLNFLYYALFQAMLIYVVYFFSRSKKVAFISLGILIASVFPFNYAGGYHDFRIDFISFCLFGIFLLSGLRSDVFMDKKWSVVTGVVGAYLFMFRHNTIVYLTGIYLLTGAGIILLEFFRAKTIRTIHQSKRFIGFLMSGVTYIILVLPFLWVSFNAIASYYLSQSMNRSAIRKAQLGIETVWESMAFYPIQLLINHLGLCALTLAVLCICLLGAVTLFYMGKRQVALEGEDSSNHIKISYWYAYSFILICFLVPLCVLTFNASKSPVVGGILYPSLLAVFVVTILYIYSYSTSCSIHVSEKMRYMTSLLVVISLFTGIWIHAAALTRPGFLSRDRERVEGIVNMHLEMGRFAARMGLVFPTILFDTIRDDLAPRIATTLLYEQDKKLVVFSNVGRTGQIFSKAEAKIMDELSKTDFMLLREGPKLCYGFDILPYNRLMEKLRPKLKAYAKEKMMFLKKWRIENHTFELYATWQIQLKKEKNLFGDSGGWITHEGFSAMIPADILMHRPIMRFEGDIHKEPFKGNFPAAKAKIRYQESELFKTVPSSLLVKENRYELLIDVSEFKISDDQKTCEIKIEFDKYFIPAELGINSDTRKLVVQTPENLQLTPITTKEK